MVCSEYINGYGWPIDGVYGWPIDGVYGWPIDGVSTSMGMGGL